MEGVVGLNPFSRPMVPGPPTRPPARLPAEDEDAPAVDGLVQGLGPKEGRRCCWLAGCPLFLTADSELVAWEWR